MYTRFYGLREKPFSLTPDPRFLFLSDAHREALAHLLYGIDEGQGFIAVTGEVGTGKTTLCRTLLRRLDPSMEVAFIFHPQLSGLELLQAINSELGLPSKSDSRRDLLDSLHEFLLTKKREDRRVLLIVDEAQTLERDALEQLRLVSNLETETEKLIHIVLLGQPELDDVLERSEHRQLRQRITVRWDLGPLTPPETRAYVVHRLRVAAGARRDIFDAAGLREVHKLSGGVPRLINAICDRALLAGYAHDARHIGPDIVRQAHRELRADKPERRFMSGPNGGFDKLQVAILAAAALLLVAGTAALTWWALDRSGSVASSLDSEASPVSAGRSTGGVAIETTPAVAAAAPSPLIAEVSSPVRSEGSEPLAAYTTPPVEAAPAGMIVEPAPRSVRPASLSTQLARSSPASTAAASLDALLVAWGSPPANADVLSLPEVLTGLGEDGLVPLHLRSTSLSALAGMDQPALLVLRALDGAPRYAALTGLKDGRVLIEGLSDAPLDLAANELAAHWDGEAYVPWRDFESLPGLLTPGARGSSVSWLQQSLADLGLYAGPPNGRFDAATLAAVRALQQATRLRADGRVGPVTKIRLYQMVGGYDVPRLADSQGRLGTAGKGSS